MSQISEELWLWDAVCFHTADTLAELDALYQMDMTTVARHRLSKTYNT